MLPLESAIRGASAGTTGVAWGVRNVAHFGRGGSGINPIARARGSPLNSSCFTPASSQIVLKITHSIGRRPTKHKRFDAESQRRTERRGGREIKSSVTQAHRRVFLGVSVFILRDSASLCCLFFPFQQPAERNASSPDVALMRRRSGG